jgi:ATP-dependent Zn protease
MSTYYTQGQQPGPINFSSWSETEGHEGAQNLNVPPQPVNNQQIQQFSEDPNATKLFREHFRTARDNAIPQSSADPSATVGNNSNNSNNSNDTNTSNDNWFSTYWYVFVIIAIVIMAAIAFYYFKYHKSAPGSAASSSSAFPSSAEQSFPRFDSSFGSSALKSANGIMNDLEFL